MKNALTNRDLTKNPVPGCQPRAVSAAGGVSARLVVLLAVAALINFIDRGSLATAAPLVLDELALSNTQLGLLLSAFFWSYAPGQLPAGWLSERHDVRRVLACGLAIWGTATALAGLGGLLDEQRPCRVAPEQLHHRVVQRQRPIVAGRRQVGSTGLNH